MIIRLLVIIDRFNFKVNPSLDPTSGQANVSTEITNTIFFISFKRCNPFFLLVMLIAVSGFAVPQQCAPSRLHNNAVHCSELLSVLNTSQSIGDSFKFQDFETIVRFKERYPKLIKR